MEIKINRELLDRGVSLVHEVLTTVSISEDLRMRLSRWRQEIEEEIDE